MKLAGLASAVLVTMPALKCHSSTGALDSWEVRQSLGASAEIAYGNGRFVVAASSSPTRILVSTNGLDWKSYLPPEYGMIASLEFANGNFLLLLTRLYSQDPGAVLYSSVDGVSWVLRRLSQSSSLGIPISSAGGGNGLYVMASSDLSVSTDLMNWRTSFLGATGIRSFTSGRGLIVGNPWWGAGFIASSDGEVWEFIAPPGGYAYSHLAFANGRFAAFALGSEDGTAPPVVAVSTRNFEWIYNLQPDFTNCTRLVADNDLFFLLKPNGFYSSSDALAWSEHSFGTNLNVTDLAFGANCYVAVGDAILQSAQVTNTTLIPAALSIRTLPGITISGPVGQVYQIEATETPSNTNSWVPLTNVITISSPFLWVDTDYTNRAPRFYRALTRPPGN